MPIGKNSIKRVMNSGYSKVSTSAPDMENSHIEEEKKATARKPAQAKKPATKKAVKTPVTEAKAAPKAKTAPAAKKPATAKKAAPKTEKPTELKPISDLSPASRLEVVVERVAPEAKADEAKGGYINIGGDMPIYLL